MKSNLPIFTIVLFGTVQAATAGLYGVRPISDLSERADAVVIARVARSGEGVPLALEILETVAGELQAGTVIEASVKEPFLTVGQTFTGAQGLWFLALEGTAWHVLPVAAGDITSEDLFYRLPEETKHALLPLDDQLTGASRILAKLSVLPTNSARDRDRLTAAMMGMKSEAALRLFQAASMATDVAVREFGLAGRLSRNDATAVSELRQQVNGAKQLNTSQMIALSLETDYRNPDPAAIDALGNIALDPKASAELQRAAANALRAIHSGDCVTHLLKLTESSDPALRYAGAFGLAAYANNFPIQTSENVANLGYFSPQPGEWKLRTEETMGHVPSVDSFTENEQKYLSFWRQWTSRQLP